MLSLPTLKPGHRFALPRPLGANASADAAYLAAMASAVSHASGISTNTATATLTSSCLVIFTQNTADARRLQDEMALFAPQLRIGHFSDWETLPYDPFSPHQDLISERLATLYQLQNRQLDVVLLAAGTALYRLAPPAFLAGYTFHFTQGQTLDAAALKDQLTLAGYEHVSNVLRPGEYAVRGSLIDLFPMGAAIPYRIDLFGDEIDSIRTFDPDTQRSQHPVDRVRLLPGREFAQDQAARKAFRARWSEHFQGNPTHTRIYQDIGAGLMPAGIEYYLPLFFEKTATFFDYLHADDVVVLHGALDPVFQDFWQDTQERYTLAATDPQRPPLPPESLFLKADSFYLAAKPFAQFAFRNETTATSDFIDWAQHFAVLPTIQAERGAQDPLHAFKQHLAQTANQVLILAQSTGRRESLRDFFRANHLLPEDYDSVSDFLASDAKLGLVIGNLARGFIWMTQALELVTETELFASTPQARRRLERTPTSDLEALIQDLSELQIGDPVVHSEHGIGRYRGLVHLDLHQDGSLQEFLHLEYAAGSLLYVPISQLHLISRYTGVNPESAPLHKLGSTQWDKAKRKAAQQVRDSAAELLNLYASRAARQGHTFTLAAQEYEVFAQDFGFEETPDQADAIASVIQDMLAPKPMDRLICGDVGFGKTEVALRAAFIAVLGGKQVAFLAPTTLLVEQHYQTLLDRFAKWPIKVAEMSRFRTPKEVQATMQGLANGVLDIVVGTHKLLSSKVQFHNLGLLIVDEEHRFGVRHKEAIKAMRAEVDILTLTATPIPRTLGLALEGLRDLSIIATAPERRLSIKTFVREEGKAVIREAVLRELKRGGQVYFLHNEVDTIENRHRALQDLLPEARIAVAHGQMPERALEAVMRDFVAQRCNVLLCSTIIETGIDVPNANTIVISRADKLGLAQLHQLRGRVGRSHHQAYAYLMVADTQGLSKTANQRLQAITQMEDLGSGFFLAMHDLEIRGAGEVLGESQSGNLQAIGFSLYNDMLAEAVAALKAGRAPDLLELNKVQTDIKLHAPAFLPDDYCGDVHMRLSFYKKLAVAHKDAQIDAIVEELADRFGKLPPAAATLIETHRLRVLGQAIGLQRLDANSACIILSFSQNTTIDPGRIVALVQKDQRIQLAGNDKLRVVQSTKDAMQRAQMVREVLHQLAPSVS